MAKCVTKYCRGIPSKNNIRCSKCKHKELKEKDPVKYAFNLLRTNARRRGKVFTLTIEYFRTIVAETGYGMQKGEYKERLSIDRIDNYKGYEEGNIRVVTVSENAKKGTKEEAQWKEPF